MVYVSLGEILTKSIAAFTDQFGERLGFTWGTLSFLAGVLLIVTSTQEQLQALLDNDGRIAGAGSHTGSLFVLTADKEFVQAGAKTAELADADSDWDSNILRNTEKVALLLSDRSGLIAFEAQLVSKDPTIARSLGGIINGLVSLQAFNEEIDPALRTIIQNTKIEVLDNVLSIDTVFDSNIVVRMLDERHDDTE